MITSGEMTTGMEYSDARLNINLSVVFLLYTLKIMLHLTFHLIYYEYIYKSVIMINAVCLFHCC